MTPATAAEIAALIMGPVLLLISVMLNTRGGPLYRGEIVRRDPIAAGLGSLGMLIFLTGGLVMGLSAAMYPERQSKPVPSAWAAIPAASPPVAPAADAAHLPVPIHIVPASAPVPASAAAPEAKAESVAFLSGELVAGGALLKRQPVRNEAMATELMSGVSSKPPRTKPRRSRAAK